MKFLAISRWQRICNAVVAVRISAARFFPSRQLQRVKQFGQTKREASMTATEKRLDAQPAANLASAGKPLVGDRERGQHGDAGARAGSGHDCLRAAKRDGRSDAHRGHRHRHAERFLRAGRMGRLSRRRLPAGPQADRAAAAAAAGAARGRRAGDLGQLGQPSGPGEHAAQPDPPLQADRRRRRSRRSPARQRRPRAGEGFLGGRGGR